MRLSILPVEHKIRILKRYQEHIVYLKQFDNIDHVVQDYKNILNFMETDNSEDVERWKYKTFKVDRLRNEQVFQVFPELEGIV